MQKCHSKALSDAMSQEDLQQNDIHEEHHGKEQALTKEHHTHEDEYGEKVLTAQDSFDDHIEV